MVLGQSLIIREWGRYDFSVLMSLKSLHEHYKRNTADWFFAKMHLQRYLLISRLWLNKSYSWGTCPSSLTHTTAIPSSLFFQGSISNHFPQHVLVLFWSKPFLAADLKSSVIHELRSQAQRGKWLKRESSFGDKRTSFVKKKIIGDISLTHRSLFVYGHVLSEWQESN